MKHPLYPALALAGGIFLSAVSCGLAIPVSVTEDSTQNNIAIPDNNPNGIASSINLNTSITSITSVTLTLDISGGYNGDYYAYISDGSAIAVLLNRTGVSGSNPFGYGDSGFNVTFSDSAANGNIHFYQTVAGYSVNGNGQLTGTWAPDGRYISPLSSGATIASTSPTDMLSSFDGLNPNATWTLFIADDSALNTGTLVDWSLTVNGDAPGGVSIPDNESTLALLALTLGFGALMFRFRNQAATRN